MGPATLDFWLKASSPAQEALAKAQHFLIDLPIGRAATSLCDYQLTDIAQNQSDFIFCLDLPGPSVVFDCEDFCVAFFEAPRGDLTHTAAFYMPGMTSFLPIGLRRRSGIFEGDKGLKYVSDSGMLKLALLNIRVMDICASLISEPRLVTLSRPPRAMRKRSQKALGAPPALGWHKVGWTVGDATRAKSGEGGMDHSMPLHFCRAHWRKSEKGKPSAEKRYGRTGYWVWVKHSFKGHPDNGIRLHHYMPKIEAKGKSAATIAATKAMYQAWSDQQRSRLK